MRALGPGLEGEEGQAHLSPIKEKASARDYMATAV